MAKLQKKAFLQDLDEIQSFITEEGLLSKYFNITDLPLELPMGKSSMLIMGSPALLDGVILKIELVDSLGEPIYIEPVYNYSESGGVRVGIEVYKETAAGAATLTILGELDPDKVDENIPDQWRGTYNVKYTRNITINKSIPNDRPIRFFKRPKLQVIEIIKGQVSLAASTTGSNEQTVGTIIGTPVQNTEGSNFSIDGDNYQEVQTYADQVYGFNPMGNYEEYDSTDPRYTITIADADFSSSIVGGAITIDAPNVNLSFSTGSDTVIPKYTSRISNVVNKKTIEVQKPFGVYDSGSGFYRIAELGSSSYKVNWPKFHEYDTSSINFKSFADIRLSKLRNFSGDVHRIAGYVKNNGPFGNWSKIIDTPVESPELLLDPLSITGTSRIGFFNSDTVATTYWKATGGKFGVESATTVQTYSSNEYLTDSIFMSGSNVDLVSDDDEEWIKLQLKDAFKLDFIANTEYKLKIKLVADNTGGQQNTIKAVAHMSGSAFGMSQNNIFAGQGYGRAIGIVTHNNSAGNVVGTTSPQYETVFTPDSDGTAVLQLRFTGGYWSVSEISIKPNSDTNFSPEYIRLIAPVPPLQTRPDYLDFAFEFYDVNNNKSQTVVTSLPDNPDGVKFDGENMNILGNDNLIGGSVYIGGDSIGAGIQFGGVNSTIPETGGSGATESGFIRSVKYQGFTSASQDNSNTGFMIYSGSVLPDSGDDYSGVGLELVGESGSFRFGTNPSRFEVIADSFFVGSTNSQFVSGSGGNIEISSSAFHLSPSGDVIMSGSVTAAEGYIGNWQIVNGKLSGSNATLDAVGAALYKSDAGPDSNPLDGYYIDFTPGSYYVRFGTDFAVSSSGQLFASGAKIEGVLTSSEGYIGNWTIAPNTLHYFTNPTYTGLSSAGDTRFFAGAASLAASGSAPFNVKASGDITGSKVLLTGGKIAAFNISDDAFYTDSFFISASATNDDLFISASNFNVSADGNVSASDLYISGGTTVGGNIVGGGLAGWTISETSIVDDNNIVKLEPAGAYIISSSDFQVSSAGEMTASAGKIAGFEINGTQLKQGTSFFLDGASNGTFFISSSDFQVTPTGQITASEANITGDITANTITATTAGNIANFTVASTGLTSTGVGMHPAGQAHAFTAGTGGTPAFSVTHAGQITASAANITGDIVANTITANTTGTIANFDIDSIEIASSNNKLRLKSSGQITASAAKISGSGVEIAAPSFILDTDNFDINSTIGTVALGTTPTLTGGTGVFMSSSGEFRLGDPSSYLSFVNDAFKLSGSDIEIDVTDLNISSSGFTLSSPEASMSLGNSKELLLHATGGTNNVPIIKLDGGEISASNFFVSTAGEITASGGTIGGWSMTSASIESSNKDIQIFADRLAKSDGTGGPGFIIRDQYQNDVVSIVSGSLYEIGAATDEAKNDSFEVTESGWSSDGYHIGNSSSPLTVHSWSFSAIGPVSHSITRRSGTSFTQFNKALVGDYTFDIVRPGYLAPIAALSSSDASISASYAAAKVSSIDENQYTLSQEVSASSQATKTWIGGNVISFAFVGKMSHSLAGSGYDRGLESQKYKVDYWSTGDSEWKQFIPAKTGSDGFGSYDLATRYTSVKSSNQLPESTHKLRIVLSGSINSDIEFKTSEDLYEELELDPVFKYMKDAGLLPAPVTGSQSNVNASSAKYPYTELSFDNFRLVQDQPRIQISQTGFLLYQSENSYLKMTPAGMDMRSSNEGGMAFGKSVTGRSAMGGAGVFGRFAAPKLQAYDADPNTIEAYSFAGNTDEYARGNHAHILPFDTVRDVLDGQTLINFTSTGIDDNANATAITIDISENVTFAGNILLSGTVDGRDVATDGTKLDGIEASATADQTNAEIRTAVEAATDSNVFTDSDHTKLNAIEASATADQSNAEIRTAVEAASDSNVFTDADHSKLNAIEASADVTDTTNVTAAGALMDSELTSIADVKALDQSVVNGASPTFLTTNFTDAPNKRLMTDAQETKLDSVESSATADQSASEIRALVQAASDSQVFTDNDHIKLDAIEANADITDTTNVTSAGALMDSELTSITDVKGLDQSVISGASPTFGTANFTDTSNKRLMTDAQETKLDSVESSATADQTNAEIRTAVEAASDSNVFTDADHTKLNTLSGVSITSAGVSGSYKGDGVFSGSAQINHDATTNFVANEHIDWTSDQGVTNIHAGNYTDTDTTYTVGDGGLTQNNFTNTLKTKLDGIETSATADQSNAEIRTAVEAASDSNVFTDADHTKLNAIEASATADQSNAEIRTAVEAATDSNVFTDGDHTKLNAIEASADVTDTTNVTSAGALMDSELTGISHVKALNQSVVSGATPTFTTTNFTDASNKRLMTDAQETLLDSVESGATADQTAAEILTAIKTVDGAASGLDADLLDGQTGTYYTDFSNITVTSGEVSNAMLANSSINFGGISLSLGGSDTTPAFALADATGLPIVAGTTGTLSVARGGTGVTTSTGTGNTVLSASPTFTGTLTAAAGTFTGALNAGTNGAYPQHTFHGQTNFYPDADSGLEINNQGGNATGVVAKTGDGLYLGANGAAGAIHVNTSQQVTFPQNTTFQGDAISTKANGVISGSSTSTGSFGIIQLAKSKYLEFNDGTTTKWQIFNNASNEFEIKSSAYGGSPIRIDATGGGVNVHANLDVGAGVDVTGNITVTGTVDGRDILADGTRLDGIETNATADQTAAEILTAVKTVDGAGTGLDADLLDGQHGSYYTDFSNMTVDNDEIPIAKLASDNVNFGGITVALGASDTTPAFALADATGLPIIAGTTGTLSVARGGTGVTSKTGTGNVVLSASPTLTGHLGTGTIGTTSMWVTNLYDGSSAANSSIVFGGGSKFIKFYTDGQNSGDLALTLDSSHNATFSGDVRIGGTSLTPSGDKDQLVVESTSHGGMSALGPDASEQGFFTGHASSTRVGEFHTRYDTNTMTIGSAKSGMQMLLMTGNRATALTLDSSQNATFAGNVILGDSDTLVMGAGSDYQLYHNGSHSYLISTTGNMYYKQESAGASHIFMTKFGGGSVSSVFEVTDAGITVAQGNATFAGTIGSGAITSTGLITGTDLTISGTSTTIGTVTSGIWNAGAVTSTGTVTAVDGIFSGNLSVAGTMTTTTTNEVVLGDQILTLNGGSSAGDGGIYVNDAATAQTGSLLWDVSEDRWIGGLKDSEINLVTISSDDTLTNKTLTSPDINGGTWNGTVDGNSTAAGITWADLGSVTTIDINGGDIASGVTINKSPVVNFNSGDVQGSITLTNLASGTGGLTIQATSVEGSMLNDNVISGQGALGSATVAQADLFLMDDGPGTLKKVTFANLEDSLWNNITGDVLINSSGLATIQENSVALTTDTTGNYVQSIVSSTGLSGGVDSEGATATLSVDASQTQVTEVGTLTAGTWNASDIALGTYTSGNYVGTLSVGAGMAAVNADSEGSSKTIAVDGVLEDLDTLGAAASDGQFIVATGAGTFGYESTTVARTSLGVGTGDSPSFAGLTSTDDIILDGSGDSIYNTFVTGMFGTGWSIDYGANGSSLEIDNIVVRNTLRTHIFQKDTVKATNGALYISDSCVIDSIPSTTTIKMQDNKSAIFAHAALQASAVSMWCKDANSDDGSITSVKFTLDGVDSSGGSGETAYTVYDVTYSVGASTDLQTGMTAVRISGGSLLLDASSTGAPYMDVIDDSGGIRVRVGQVKQEADYDKYGILGQDGSGNRVFEISEQRNEIAGWSLTTDAISKSNISLNATIPSLRVTDGTRERVRVGDLNGVGGYTSAKYGVIGFDGDGVLAANATFELSNERNMIAGWDLVPGNIESDNATGSVRLSSVSQSLTIWTGSMNEAEPKLVLGKLPLHDGTVDSPYGFAVFSGSGTVSGSEANASVLITANKARLAGWELVPGQLKSGTVARIDGNQATIALGANANQTHTTAQDNLFYVSASATPTFFVGSNFSFINNVLKAGGWKIGNGMISSSNGNAILSGSGVLSLGTGTNAYGAADRIYLDPTTNNGRMSIGEHFGYTDDVLTVAGWVIDSGQITGTNAKLYAAGILSLGTGTDAYNSANRIYIDGSTDDGRMSMGTGFRYTGGSLTIDGNASIAGWDISTSAISKGKTKITSTTNNSSFAIQDTVGINNPGIFIGQDNNASLYKMSLSGSAGRMLWDNTALKIYGNNGTEVFTTTNTGATIGGWSLGASSFKSSNWSAGSGGELGGGSGQFSSAGIKLHDTGYISSPAFWLDTSGNAKFKGDISAGTGTLGNALSVGSNFSVDSSGNMTASNAQFSGSIQATSGTFIGDVTADTITANTAGEIGGFGITPSEISSSGASGNTGLRLKANGQITASAAKITGDITATTGTFTNVDVSTGTIGGFLISNTIDSDAGAGQPILKLKGSTGQITASAAQITGDITATSGEFRNQVYVGASSARVIIDGANKKLYSETGGFDIRGSGYASFSNGQVVFNANGSGTIGSTISWTTGGVLSVGKITATAGSIGGFGIDGHSLTATGVEINDATQALFISSSAFKVDHTGNITASNVALSGDITATAGAIGGFTIANTHITGSGGKFVSKNKSTDNFGIGNTYWDVTKRTEILPNRFVVRSYSGNPHTVGVGDFIPSHIVFDAPATHSFTYFNSEFLTYYERNAVRTENVEFGTYDPSDAWTGANLVIGYGGKTNANIRTVMNDSLPGEIIYPDTGNDGWVIGDKLAVQAVGAGGVSITNASYRFSVVGTSYFSDDVRLAGGLGVGVAANATNGTIYASNNIVAYASDRRLKENVETIKSPLEKVLGLEGVTFNWNELAEKEAGFNRRESQVGLLAQDLQKVLPEAVKIAPFDSDPSGSSISGEKYLTIQYERVVPLLVESIKEMGSLIGDLESRIKQLESKE